jgi:GT2 family glycosyltransferase
MTSILILNVNGRQHLQKCLLALPAFTKTPHEIIVIDNGSSDGSQDYLRTVGVRNLTVVENPENIGCPPARAQGMALAKGDYVVLLDNDTIVTAGWLTRLIGHCENDAKIGLLGPSTNYITGPQRVPGVKYTDLQSLAGIAAQTATHFAGMLQPTTRLVGFCMFIRRAVIDRIGCCDATFGKYGFEDDDYSYRAILAGFDAYIARDVFIHHTGNSGHVDAGLDYPTYVREAWSVFHAKWGLPANMTVEDYGKNPAKYMPERAFDVTTDYIPLPDVGEIEACITRRP